MGHTCFNRYRPLGLVFNGPEDENNGGGNDPQDLGFPANTPWRDMKPEEQVKYWQHQSKRHERTAKERENFDKFKADSEELGRVKAANQTEQEKAVADARRQGEQAGSSKYLKDAVAGHLRGLTRKSAEDISEALQFVDVNAFTSSDGSLDLTRLDTFAKQLGGTQEQQDKKPNTSHFDTLNRGDKGKPRTGTSLADKRKATRDSLTPTRS